MITLGYPVSKQKMAFQFSVDKLFRDSSKVYMWTVTMKQATPDTKTMYCWNKLSRELQHEMPLLRGLRITERHPGAKMFEDLWVSHGLHFHLLVNSRIPKWLLDRIGRKWGFGFTWVRKADMEKALYCGKYMTKQNHDLQTGCRKWGTIGGFESTRVRDVEMDSTFHRNFRKVQKAVQMRQMSLDLLHTIYLNSEKFGDIAEWPIERIFYGANSRQLLTPEMLGILAKEYADPTHKSRLTSEGKSIPWRYKKLTRVNHTKTEIAMQKRAKIWKALGNQRQRRVESETKPSKKIFEKESCILHVKKPDIVPRGTVYWLDKIPRKWVGMTLAEHKAWLQKVQQLPG